MRLISDLLVILIPSIIATVLLYRNDLRQIGKIKIILTVLLWMAGINLTLFVSLYLIGINLLELTDIGIGFKIKYVILEMGLMCCALVVKKLMQKTGRKQGLKHLVKILPETIFLIVTYVVFAPSSLFLSNIDEFSISYIRILPVIVMVALLVFLCIGMVAVLLEKETRLVRWKMFVFGLALGFYLQSNFLNPNLPELNGIAIDWSQYTFNAVISTIVWILCIGGIQIIVSFGRERIAKITQYASWFLSAVQMVTLMVLLLTTTNSNGSNIALLKEDEFTVGSKNNVVIFVLDSLGAAKMEEILGEEPQIKENLKDFTFFANAVSGGAYTSVAMPMFLTGMEFDPSYKSYDDYMQEAWSGVELYDDLKELNYDIRIFTDGRYLTDISEDVVTNAMYVGDGYYIDDYIDFTKDIYQFTNFYSMPQLFKQNFWMYSDDITRQIKTTGWETREDENKLAVDAGADNYYFDDVQFYQDFLDADGLEVKYENTYRLYHLLGAHPPYTINEDVQHAESTETAQIKGCMKVVNEYIDELKKLDLYNMSTIIITADHGKGTDAEGIQQNPCLLIKMPQECHELVYNDAPIHFRNVMATIVKSTMGDYAEYGPSVYDIDQNSDVERLHTVAAPVRGKLFPNIPDETPFSRFIIPENAREVEAIEVYDPPQINDFDYQLGDEINFADNSYYMDQIDYRIYKEDGMGIASTELALYMRLQDYKKGDLNFEFTYSKVYNDSQSMGVYVAGEKVADITCRTEDSNKMISVFIKEQYIKDGVLPIRLVFRNAVTPKMIGVSTKDSRVLSVGFDSMKVTQWK